MDIGILVLEAYIETLRFINDAPEDVKAAHYARLSRLGSLLDKLFDDLDAAVQHLKKDN